MAFSVVFYPWLYWSFGQRTLNSIMLKRGVGYVSISTSIFLYYAPVTPRGFDLEINGMQADKQLHSPESNKEVNLQSTRLLRSP